MFVGASVSVGALFSVFENVQTSMLTCCAKVRKKSRMSLGDPSKCREHARHCVAASPVVRDHFTSLEQSWLRLAAEIESGEWLLYLFGEISRDLVPIAEAAE